MSSIGTEHYIYREREIWSEAGREGDKGGRGEVMSCHVMSCHVMSCHVMSCHVMSCHVMSCHVMSCHDT